MGGLNAGPPAGTGARPASCRRRLRRLRRARTWFSRRPLCCTGAPELRCKIAGVSHVSTCTAVPRGGTGLTLLTMFYRRACVLFYCFKLSSCPVAALVGGPCSHRPCSPAHLN